MPINIPPSQPIPLRAQLPDDPERWPAPFAWTPSDPEHATVRLDDVDPFAANLQCSLNAPDISVSLSCGELHGQSDVFHVVADAPVPEQAVLVALT